jgi:hypothetical protein
LRPTPDLSENPPLVSPTELNRRELGRYVRRVNDRWPLERALLGGARRDDGRGAGSQRERGPEYVVVLVSQGFAGIPWLERVYHAASLWDASEMGAPADVHCYTSAEFDRKRDSHRTLGRVLVDGLDLLAAAEG